VVLLSISLLEDRVRRVLLVDHLVVHVHHPLLQAQKVETGSTRTVQTDGVLLVNGDRSDGIGVVVLGQAQRDLQRQRHQGHPVNQRCVVVGGEFDAAPRCLPDD